MTDAGKPSVRAIAEEAADWYLRFEDEGGIPLAERQRLVEWLKASPTHVAEFMRVRATHGQIEGLDRSALPEVDELLQQALSNVVALADAPEDGPPQGVDPARKRITWATAASIAAAVLLSGWYLALRPMTLPGGSAAGAVYETTLGEQRSLVLSDGSVVALNTQSKLRVFLTDDERLVELAAGEAVFDVAKDPRRPFRVTAGTTVVEAVGTRFNVYRQRLQTVVTVIEGRVAVSRPAPPSSALAAGKTVEPGASALELIPGDELTMSAAGDVSKRATVDTGKAIAWTDRRLVFDGDSLATVARELNRYNRPQLTIADAALGQRPVSGVFDANDPETLLSFLETIGGVRVERRSGTGWVLYSSAAPAASPEQR